MDREKFAAADIDRLTLADAGPKFEHSEEFGLDRLNVLVVAADAGARSAIKDSLFAVGIRNPRKAGTGAEGHRMLASDNFDLIIVDNNLSRKSGLDFTRAVRGGEDRESAETPIILVFGRADIDTAALARDSGAHDFITRPFSTVTLFRQIRETDLNPRRFIRADSFIGPDRRQLDIQPWIRTERRAGHKLHKTYMNP